MNPELLKAGLSVITQVSNSPIMIVVKDKVLILGGHSDTSTLVMNADVDHDDFHVVLPIEHAKQLAKVLGKKLDVSLEEDTNGNLTVTQGRSRFTYTTLPVDSISYKLLLLRYKDDFWFKIDGDLLSKGVSTVLNFATGEVNDVRAKNIHMSVENGVVELAASNGSSLAVYNFPAKETYSHGDLPVTLVGRVLTILGKTMPGEVQIGFVDKNMYYRAEDANFVYKGVLPTVDHPPFPYKPLIAAMNKATNTTRALLEKEDFLDKAKAVMYFTEENVKNRVDITFAPKNVTMEGANDRGSFTLDFTPIACDATAPMKMSLGYLIRVASAVTGSELNFQIVDGRFFVKEDRFTCVIPQLKS